VSPHEFIIQLGDTSAKNDAVKVWSALSDGAPKYKAQPLTHLVPVANQHWSTAAKTTSIKQCPWPELWVHAARPQPAG